MKRETNGSVLEERRPEKITGVTLTDYKVCSAGRTGRTGRDRLEVNVSAHDKTL